MTDLPRYRGHKEVEALKIAHISLNVNDGTGTLRFADPWPAIKVDPAYMARVPMEGCEGDDCGYYVRDADGDESWSPTRAFEEGYTLVATSEPPDS